MAETYTHIRQVSPYDLVKKDYISVTVKNDTGQDQQVEVPVFLYSFTAQFVNADGQALSSPDLFYTDEYSQTWTNAPNTITLFIQDAVALGYYPYTTSSGNLTYIPLYEKGLYEGFSYQNNLNLINQGLQTYFSTNTRQYINTSASLAPYIQSPTNASDLSQYQNLTRLSSYIGTGHEGSGTLSTFFTRPSDAQMNPTGLNNVAQGCYPYTDTRFISGENLNFWVGEWGQLFGFGGDISIGNACGFDSESGQYIRDITLRNSYFTLTGQQYIAVPKFFEPIDYYISGYTGYNSDPQHYTPFAQYRRVYFGIRPFNA